MVHIAAGLLCNSLQSQHAFQLKQRDQSRGRLPHELVVPVVHVLSQNIVQVGALRTHVSRRGMCVSWSLLGGSELRQPNPNPLKPLASEKETSTLNGITEASFWGNRNALGNGGGCGASLLGNSAPRAAPVLLRVNVAQDCDGREGSDCPSAKPGSLCSMEKSKRMIVFVKTDKAYL